MSFDVEVRMDTRRVGRLIDQRGAIHFEYDRAFLSSGLELSPFKVPLQPGVFSDGPPDFHGLPGLVHDTLPDGWGLLLMHRRMRANGIDPQRVSVLAWLRFLGDRAMGALSFHPPDGGPANEQLELSLQKLERESRQVLDGTAAHVLPELELAGGSPGGARPKVVVAIGPRNHVIAGTAEVPAGFEHWLIKFGAKDDPTDMGPLEETYARLARDAGIEMPDTRLFTLSKARKVFGVRRFDRLGNTRVHMQTIGGLLHVSHRVPTLDYKTVLATTWSLTRNRGAMLEAFRRAVFNVFAHNRDDHAHNFSFLMNARGAWRLSPAYDLTPSAGPGGYHSTSVMGEALRPGREHLLELARALDLKRASAELTMKQVQHALAKFASTAKQVGVSAATTRRVESLIC